MKELLKLIKKTIKKHFVVTKKQIPLLCLIFGAAFSTMFIFSNSKTSHFEELANEIAKVAQNSKNNQMTMNFYPQLGYDENYYENLQKIIIETNKFNFDKYSYYRGNGHKVRVVANSEQKTNYWFPELEIQNPAMILENTFSTAWGEEHLYENLDLNLLNKKSKLSPDGKKHFFINESDAEYLIQTNERFSGCTLDDIPGKTLSLYYVENGITKHEDWTISNVILKDQEDDKLYKSLYSSYIVADFHIPLIKNSFCIAFDFSTSKIDNTNYLNQIYTRYVNHKNEIETNNLIKYEKQVLDDIKANYLKLPTFETKENKNIIIAASIIAVVEILVFLWCYLNSLPSLSTSLMAVLAICLVYIFFHICSLSMNFNVFTRSFNFYSLFSLYVFLSLTLFTIIFASLFYVEKEANKVAERKK